MIDKEEEKTLKELRINEQRNKEEVYLIKGKLQEKDDELRRFQEKYEKDLENIKLDIENKFTKMFHMVDIKKLD